MLSVEIKTLEDEIAALEETLRDKKAKLHQLKKEDSACTYSNGILLTEEIVRYSRQMIMPQVTINGQIALKKSKVLVVGAGGLGCPASLYLAAAGIGELHIVDYDEVELSNLHRQILHYEVDLGKLKVQSACEKLKQLNSNIVVIPRHIHANSSIVDDIIKHKYDLVLDCTDNAPTRYLLNDVCVIHNIPLVSGSALQIEGQLTVYHYNDGPCYRCLFPTPPPAHTVTNCGDGGVLGAVPGVIGVLQALEAVKILTKIDGVLSGRMLLFDGAQSVFRNVKLRGKMKNCDVCGENSSILAPVDYEQFCGSKAHDKVININVLTQDDNVGVDQMTELLKEGQIVLDVRPELEYTMCNLPSTINIPYSKITSNKYLEYLDKIIKDNSKRDEEPLSVYVLCRRGNDSQRAVAFLKENYTKGLVKFVNIKGGLHAYANLVDNAFPVY